LALNVIGGDPDMVTPRCGVMLYISGPTVSIASGRKHRSVPSSASAYRAPLETTGEDEAFTY
jgi:hypothetical protein